MSMQQPSAQGIASLYRGNPQPLQQRIQNEQQANPDLPPDLKKMLALQIVTNETDAVKKQKAMDQLQQMGGPQGEPPTVMQTLQQQAEQKMQAQAVQARQKQQGIESLMQQMPAGGVPEGTPQPEQQPEAQMAQGIDQLPAEFQMAGGGIVAFASGASVPYDPATATRRVDFEEPDAYKSLPEKLMYEAMKANPKQAAEDYRKRLTEEVGPADTSQIDRLMEELEKRKAKLEGPKSGFDRLSEYLGKVAEGGAGRKWYEAGAQGAAGLAALNKERETQQSELTKQGIELAQKKLDAQRSWKEKLFTESNAELKRVGDNAYNAAIAQGKNEADAEKARQEAIQKQLDRENQMAVTIQQGKNSLASASVPGATERVVAKIQALRKIGTPEALKQADELLTLHQSVTGGGTAGVGATRNMIQSIRLQIKTYENILDPIKGAMATDEQKQEAAQKLAVLQRRLEILSGMADEEEGAGKAPPAPTEVLKFDASGKPIK
jgi:hypothetical protein